MSVGIRLIVEVLDHAPADLTPGEFVVLLVLAEYANDTTRQSWPGMRALSRRARMQPDTVGKALRRLSRRGLEVRVPIGWNKAGRPVFAHHGRQTSYRIPPLRSPDRGPTIEDTKPGPRADLQDAKGLPLVRERSAPRPLKPGPRADPSPHEPSIEPSTAAVRGGRAEALTMIKYFTDDTELAQTVLELFTERKPRSLVAYVRKIVDDGGMPEWIDRAHALLAQRFEAAQRTERAAFLAERSADPCCEHGYPGGHVRDETGWMRCPIQRNALAAVPGGDPWQQ